MRYAILSDIHANLEALVAVLAAVDAMRVDRIVCLGDLVGYGANPNECVRLIAERRIQCIRGNHDAVAAGLARPRDFNRPARRAIRWTRKQLSADVRAFLRRLPVAAAVDGRFIVVHGSLHPRPNETTRIHTCDDAGACLEMLRRHCPGINLCFFGHTHHPVAYADSGGRVRSHTGPVFEFDGGAPCLVNPGSVGQPRDLDLRAAFAIYDTESRAVRFQRVNYDRAAAWHKLERAGLLHRPGLAARAADRIRDAAHAGWSFLLRGAL